MGAGKLRSPGGEPAGGEQQSAVSEQEDGSDSRRPLTIAEVVSELLYAGKTIQEIASYDDLILRFIVFRPRSNNGSLIRKDPDLPEWVEVDDRGMRTISNPVSFSSMFLQVKENQGLAVEKVADHWQRFLAENPGYGKYGG